MDLLLGLNLAENDTENSCVFDSLCRTLSQVRKGRVASVTDQGSVTVDPAG